VSVNHFLAFNKNPNNTITFWDFSSDNKWPSHLLVNKVSKFHEISSILPSKTLWDLSRKEECDSIVKKWQMYFQASKYKGKNFLDLNNDNGCPIYSSYSKSRVWLKYFGVRSVKIGLHFIFSLIFIFHFLFLELG